MKKFIINTNNKYIMFLIVSSIVIITVILALVFEPFAEIPFVYNQF